VFSAEVPPHTLRTIHTIKTITTIVPSSPYPSIVVSYLSYPTASNLQSQRNNDGGILGSCLSEMVHFGTATRRPLWRRAVPDSTQMNARGYQDECHCKNDRIEQGHPAWPPLLEDSRKLNGVLPCGTVGITWPHPQDTVPVTFTALIGNVRQPGCGEGFQLNPARDASPVIRVTFPKVPLQISFLAGDHFVSNHQENER
jgi:hypothetical protein